MYKQLLANLVADTVPRWPGDDDVDAARLLEEAVAEGVVALVDRKFRSAGFDAPPALRQVFSDASRGEVAKLLVRQAECRRQLGRLQAAGMPVLLLKGSALAYWAYPEPHLRDCVDVDLLFRSCEDAMAAAALLAEDGYVRRQHFAEMATSEFLCRKDLPAGGKIYMDMHWALASSPTYASRFAFKELAASAIPLPGLAPGARGLSPVHAFMHACMHRAADLCQGGGDQLKWLNDIRLVAGRLDFPQWTELLWLARERQLSGTCLDALEGAAALMAVPVPADVLEGLATAAAAEPLDRRRLRDWSYMQRQKLSALPGWGQRVRWLWHRFVPTRHYREDVGESARGNGLLWHRLGRLLRRLPGA